MRMRALMRTVRRAVPGTAVPVLAALLILSVLVTSAIADTRASFDAAERASGSDRLWVFFSDKSLDRAGEELAIAQFRGELSERALRRRAKAGLDVNVNDLPVAARYIAQVRETGAEVVTVSRWMNAVSVRADDASVASIARLPFVREVRPVAGATKPMPRIEPASMDDVDRGGARPQAGGTSRSGPRRSGSRSLDYGESWGQNDQVQIIDLHDDGFDGDGVVIAMLDTGFDTDHQAYRHLDILGERDFINDDTETANEPGDPGGQDSHGTATLSNVGAAYAGEIYGGSYEATFILCKTEIVDDEIQVEEDYWVEAVEYADSLGADLISSSLGYFYWYDYSDMDGNTCVTTIAADMAAARGITVITSMGNEGGNDWKYMIAPSDGDSVLGIGAVDIDGDRVSFSSVGPTYDGRIKPDVMALGASAYVATTSDTASYGYSSGTSFSCPITAGAVGLLLQGHPEWLPEDVIEAVHTTATQSSSPDTLMGWGILRASDAMYSSPLGVQDEPAVVTSVVWSAPNPFTPGTSLHFVMPEAGHARLAVYDVSGRLVRRLLEGAMSAGPHETSWDGTDDGGREVASGVYFARLETEALSASTKMVLVR